jgi:hypothetical protein
MMPYGRRLFSVSVLVLLPLFAMEECNRPMVPVPVGGGYAPSQPSYQAPPIAPGADRMPMLQDPEETFDESISVYADSPEDAQRRCENIAQTRSSEAITTCLGCRLMTTPRTGRYACTLKTESRKQP